MARVTVEDCLQRIPNRFSLVLIAARRTRRILQGEPPLVGHNHGNKEAVTALREIAAGRVSTREMSDEEVEAEIEARVQADRSRELGLFHRY
jgi:DNA-directed RNA polymerase subunit omega